MSRIFIFLFVGTLAWLSLSGQVAAQNPVAVAFAGEPFSVGMIEIPLRNPALGEGPGELWIEGNDQRVLHAISQNVETPVRQPPSQQPIPRLGQGRLLGRVGNLIRELAGGEDDASQIVARRIYFLLRSETSGQSPARSIATNPISIQVLDRNGVVGNFPVSVIRDPNGYQELLGAWWNGLLTNTKQRMDDQLTSTWVDVYLVTMLSERLRLPLPAWLGNPQQDQQASKGDTDPLLMTLQWIAGAAKVSSEVFTAAAIGHRWETNLPGDDVMSLPLPAPPDWPLNPATSLDSEETLAAIEIEPLANQVPPECFYIRYGKYENFLWFQDLTDEFGGDISRMITLSGLAREGAARLQSQLGIKTSALSRILGPTIITDQALIGRDLYLDDGAAMGVLFQATNAFLLRTSLNNDRQNLASNSPDITLEQVRLEHGPASLMRSSDNRVRSFMVEHNEFILVTNSESIADRFLQVAQDKQSLGASESFRLSRKWMPLSRDDTIFAYFSPEMLQGLLSPQYLIELRRRMQSEADISLVHLARLAAKKHLAGSEAMAPSEIEPLVEEGFLPEQFGQRPDGSGVIALGEDVLDTRRGARGSFLPIPDRLIENVTPDEARWYEKIAIAYESQFSSLDPIAIGLHRESIASSEDGEAMERLSIHAEIAPWQPENYGWWAKQLGPPTRVKIRHAPDDLVSVQAHVASDTLGPPTHLFAAVKDVMPPEPEAFDGMLSSFLALRTLPAYLGAWPLPGALDRLPLGLGRGRPVGPNMNRLLGGVYRYTGGGFSILSFFPDMLMATLPQLAAEETEQSAQVRLHIGNLRGSQLEGWVNAQLYSRASEGSLAGVGFLNDLTQQLGVPSAEAIGAVERILDATPQCSLGGTYQYQSGNEVMLSSSQRWYSDAWVTPSGSIASQPTRIPPVEYRAPVLQWFRGMSGQLTQYENRLVADLEVDIARQAPIAANQETAPVTPVP
ncbi:MAG: hypothetical protein AB8B91_02660 [Rubripirellula sp.]